MHTCKGKGECRGHGCLDTGTGYSQVSDKLKSRGSDSGACSYRTRAGNEVGLSIKL